METVTLIAQGTTAAESSTIEVAENQTVTLNFIGNGKILLLTVDDSAAEQREEMLLSTTRRSHQLTGPYRFKVRRPASPNSVGMRMFRSA